MLIGSIWTLSVMAAGADSLEYPETERVDQVDTFFGVQVRDPYRWLEGDVRRAPEVAEWVAAQNRTTFAYLKSLPEREPILKRLTELWNYERYSAPFKEGGRSYYAKNDGLQNQSVIYVMDALDSEPRVLLDPNTWSEDGTVALSGMAFSDDGRYVAYSVSASGSDWQTWHVMDIASGRVLPDEVKWVKYSGASWTQDGEGFFYSRYDAPEEGAEFQGLPLNQKVYFHHAGSPQEEDVLVYWRPDQPAWQYATHVTEDGQYLILSVRTGTDPKNRVLYKDLREPYGMPVELIGSFENLYGYVGNDGPLFYFVTDRDAPKRRLLRIDIREPAPENWVEILPEREEPLEDISLVGNLFIATFLKDAKTGVTVYTMDGEMARTLDLPGIGTAAGFGGKRTDTETFYAFSSFATPPSIYRYDVITGESTLLRRSEADVDPEQYDVKQVFATSRDGTRVPMFITHKRGIALDGANPTLLTGYGGFGVPLTPGFSVSRIAWMELGGVFAVANLRGGGEYGEAWHEAGKLTRKQNVFDDFVACAGWLIDNGYTRSDKLAIQGGSNGGLLVGAVMTQRPDLFGVCLPAVGVMDMLRYHQFTAGRFWIDEYGAPDTEEMFRALRAYSPYHNIEPGTAYPATLVTTADTDDRVVPFHSFKFAARLQASQAGDAPVLIRIETTAGHGGGKPTSKVIAEAADQMAFAAHNLGMRVRTD